MLIAIDSIIVKQRGNDILPEIIPFAFLHFLRIEKDSLMIETVTIEMNKNNNVLFLL